MTSKRKPFRLAAYACLLLVAAGCSGINMRQSVSPATFLLPGLLKIEPKAAPTDAPLPEAETPKEVAFAR